MENESLILDLLEWIGTSPRPYVVVMQAWRTSCPRFTIWEDALDAGYVNVCNREVGVTDAGVEFLRARRTIREKA
jgi:hypothetical protein